MKYRIGVHGCHDSSIFDVELNDEEAAVVKRIVAECMANSANRCMPTMDIAVEIPNAPSDQMAEDKGKGMLAKLGHTDIIAALRHAEEMHSALRVIYTWAGVDGKNLDHRQVRKLAGKALHMGANVQSGRLRRKMNVELGRGSKQ